MAGAEYRPDDLAAFRREFDALKRQVNDLQRRAPLRSTSISDEDGNIIVRFNPDGLQFLHPGTGNEVAAFAGENLTFRDDNGNTLAQVDESGIHVLDAAGNEITTIDTNGLHVFDAVGVERLTAGLISGNYGIAVRDGAGNLQFQVTDNGMHQPYLTFPVTELAPANSRAVTAGAFTQVYSGQIEYTSHPGLYCWVFASCPVGTTGEIRLRAWYNGATQNTTEAVVVPSGGSVLQQFRWLHDIPLTHGPVTIYIDGRRTGGAGNLNVFQSSGITMAPPGLCVADGVP